MMDGNCQSNWRRPLDNTFQNEDMGFDRSDTTWHDQKEKQNSHSQDRMFFIWKCQNYGRDIK